MPMLPEESLMPSGATFGNYGAYTEEDWGLQAPQAGCTCGYCSAFFQYHPGLLQAGIVSPAYQQSTITNNPLSLQATESIDMAPVSGGSGMKKKLVKTKEEELVVGGIPLKPSVELTKELSRTKVLYLLRGANGSGKSTLAFLIAGTYRKVLGLGVQSIESDEFFTRVNVEGEAVFFFEESKLPEAHADCQNRVRQAMDPNNPGGEGFRVIIVSNTFVSRQHLLPYQRLAREFGYKVVEIICKNDFGNVHGVPPDKVRKTRQNFEN